MPQDKRIQSVNRDGAAETQRYLEQQSEKAAKPTSEQMDMLKRAANTFRRVS